jgi:hypothetical protein
LPGTYAVKLYTYLYNQPSDTLSVSVQIIMGSREFQLGQNTYAVDMDQAVQKGALIVYEASADGGVTRTFGFLGADSLLHTKWTKPIQGDASTVRLSSIRRISDNAYILSGNYST